MLPDLTAHLHTTIPATQLTHEIGALFQKDAEDAAFLLSRTLFKTQGGFQPTQQEIEALLGESPLSPDTAAWDLEALLASTAQQQAAASAKQYREAFAAEGGDWLPTPVPDAHQDQQLARDPSPEADGWGELGGGGGAASPLDLGLTLDGIFQHPDCPMPVKDETLMMAKLAVFSELNARHPPASAAPAAAQPQSQPERGHASNTAAATTTVSPPPSRAVSRTARRAAGATAKRSPATTRVAAEAGVAPPAKRTQTNYRGPKNHPVNPRLLPPRPTTPRPPSPPYFLCYLYSFPISHVCVNVPS